jgi:hypothetical protein
MRVLSSIRLLLLTLGMLAVPAASFAQVDVAISIGIAPPPLPVYQQPLCPDDDYIWTPGYWSYGDDDYYWVPGTWVMAPAVGLLWTPAYWGWTDGGYVFYGGYWGPHVGFYGGINYGFGYFGRGYEGGRWDNGHFFYNRSVTNVNVTAVHNVYNTRVVSASATVNRVSYNGGKGGVSARPIAAEQAAAAERHTAPVAAQAQHVQAARTNPALRASANHGTPPIGATPRPAAPEDRAVVAAKGTGAVHPAAARPANSTARPIPAVHPNELPSAERTAAPSTGNPKQDQKYQQQQDTLRAQQSQERQQLQQKQTQDHQRLAQQKAGPATTQHLEQQHQQQTQQLVQKHAQQQQKLQARQAPPHPNPPQKAKP